MSSTHFYPSSVGNLPRTANFNANDAFQSKEAPALNESIDKMVRSTRQILTEILYPKAEKRDHRSCSHRYHHHCCDYAYYPLWLRPVYFIEPYPYRRRSRGDDFEATRAIALIVAAVVGWVASSAVLSNVVCYNKSKERLSETRTFKQAILPEVEKQKPEKSSLLNRIVDLREKILKRTRDRSLWDLNTTITLVAACTITVVGSIIASPQLISAGLMAGFGTGAIMALSWGMKAIDHRQTRDAKALSEALDAFSRA